MTQDKIDAAISALQRLGARLRTNEKAQLAAIVDELKDARDMAGIMERNFLPAMGPDHALQFAKEAVENIMRKEGLVQ